ncbi:MAG: hypothetical protein K2N34_08745, partial [Lachnospiraceae bacterium]|nr:hypothetical protein [Lachnospiraceae bacterium]
ICIRDILGREIESIFSLLGDAHTYVSAYYAEPHFLKYINVHNEAGDDLTKINGICIEDLFKSKSGYYSYEREDCGIAALYQDISMLEGMTYLGFNLDDGVEYTYESEDGKEITHIVYSDDFLNWNDYMSYNNLEENSNEDKSFVRYKVDKEHNLAILYLDECKNNKEYRKVLKKMFTEIKEKNILNVAVDLRFNGGGDSSVATEFIRYLNVEEYKEWADIWRLGIFKFKNSAHTERNKKINHLLFDGNVYILTSKDTFSSAMDFAMYIKDNHFGTVIGEASGNNPNSYGMISSFKLPNSELYMQISTKKWYRLDTETTDTFIEPDIKCDSQDALKEVYKICSQEE